MSFQGNRCLPIVVRLLLLELFLAKWKPSIRVASAFGPVKTSVLSRAGRCAVQQSTTGGVGHVRPRFRRSNCEDPSPVTMLYSAAEAGAAAAAAAAAGESVDIAPAVSSGGVEMVSSGRKVVEAASARLQPLFTEVDRHTQRTLGRILDAFREFRVGTSTFAGVDGYGHGDVGRETLDKIYARVFGAEAALVKGQFFSGTHAIACCLFGVLRPGDTMLACSGRPYDTLEEVIGMRKPMNDEYADNSDPLPERLIGNLKEFHVDYKEVSLLPEGVFDLGAIDEALETDSDVRLLHVQRSCGYRWRPSLPIREIERLCAHVRDRWSERDLVVFVDNCYGEFVEDREPCHVGADLVAGSLIKNPGGTLAKSGGYVAGKRNFVRAAANRLSAPGVVGGATLGQNANLFQGLFLAPTIVGESLKGAFLLAEVFGADLGLPTNPRPPSTPTSSRDGSLESGTAPVDMETRLRGGRGGVGGRTDIVQAIELGDRARLVKFCEAVQRLSPVDAFVRPVPGVTAGYGDEVIFADGTFVDGSTLELSADGPLRPPYIVFAQGCTHWTHWALIIEQALSDTGLILPE